MPIHFCRRLSLILLRLRRQTGSFAYRQPRAVLHRHRNSLSSCSASYRRVRQYLYIVHPSLFQKYFDAMKFQRVALLRLVSLSLSLSLWVGNVTTPFHRAVPSCRVARNKTRCTRTRQSRLCVESADTLSHTHTHTHTHTNTHIRARIPSAEQYKVVQVHRVNGSSELIYAGWQAARFVSLAYAQQKQYGTGRDYKLRLA